MKTKVLVLAASLFASAILATEASAVVLRVVVVQTQDVEAYVKEVERGKALIASTGSAAIIRVWRARYAGDETGTVVVSVEYKDMAALAADEAKLATNADYKAWLKGLDRYRKIVSDSLYDELKG